VVVSSQVPEARPAVRCPNSGFRETSSKNKVSTSPGWQTEPVHLLVRCQTLLGPRSKGNDHLVQKESSRANLLSTWRTGWPRDDAGTFLSGTSHKDICDIFPFWACPRGQLESDCPPWPGWLPQRILPGRATPTGFFRGTPAPTGSLQILVRFGQTLLRKGILYSLRVCQAFIG